MFFSTLETGVKVLFFSEDKAKASGMPYQPIPADQIHPDYIDIYHPIAGWKDVYMSWCYDDYGDGNKHEYYGPWNTGFCGYKTAMLAYHAAHSWAEAEEVYLLYYSKEDLLGKKVHNDETDGYEAMFRALGV